MRPGPLPWASGHARPSAAAEATVRRMERVLLDDVVRTDHGQLDVLWSDDVGFDGNGDRFFHGQLNGLVGAADPGGVYVALARRSGGSRVRVVLLEAQPPPAPVRYEDVVEVSITVPGGSGVRWVSWAGESSGDLDGVGPGTYRLRVSAYGRDAGRAGEFAEGVVDEYLLQLWPAAGAPDAVVRVGSADARYWHRELGARR